MPGCRSPGEVRAALAYLEAGPAERDFSAIDANALWKLRRRCVYCDHCLPCPEGIAVGSLLRLLDIAEHADAKGARSAYRALARTADDCTRCGTCEDRCPFGVPVMQRMDLGQSRFSGRRDVPARPSQAASSRKRQRSACHSVPSTVSASPGVMAPGKGLEWIDAIQLAGSAAPALLRDGAGEAGPGFRHRGRRGLLCHAPLRAAEQGAELLEKLAGAVDPQAGRAASERRGVAPAPSSRRLFHFAPPKCWSILLAASTIRAA